MNILQNRKVVVFDLEIKKPIEQCSRGWKSYDEMGISALCVFDYSTGRYRMFDEANIAEGLELLNSADIRVGYNTVNFDWKVIDATVALVAPNATLFEGRMDFDILREIWKANGLNPDTFTGAHSGYKLDDVAGDTLGIHKSGHGAHAPVLYQEGRYAELFDYCQEDVRITKELFEFIVKHGYIVRNGRIIKLEVPT